LGKAGAKKTRTFQLPPVRCTEAEYAACDARRAKLGFARMTSYVRFRLFAQKEAVRTLAPARFSKAVTALSALRAELFSTSEAFVARIDAAFAELMPTPQQRVARAAAHLVGLRSDLAATSPVLAGRVESILSELEKAVNSGEGDEE
jgi:hypothetical protein